MVPFKCSKYSQKSRKIGLFLEIFAFTRSNDELHSKNINGKIDT